MTAEACRYVVLRHDGVAVPHLDVLVERSPGAALAAWRASRWPVEAGDVLEAAADHRSLYLTFEGALSGGRGVVTRVASGTCRVLVDGDAVFEALLDDSTTFLLLRDGPDGWVAR